MAWYNILFLTVLTIFILKTILTWIFGDIDIDFDADGDIDFDISSMLSFKGILHFLLGFSTYLAAVAKVGTVDSTMDIYHDTYQFSWVQYVIAVLIGLGFMYALFKLYQFIMRFNHSNDENFDVNNYIGTVLIANGQIDNNTYSYTILVHTPLGSRKIIVLSIDSNIKIGEERKIYMNEQGIYYI